MGAGLGPKSRRPRRLTVALALALLCGCLWSASAQADLSWSTPPDQTSQAGTDADYFQSASDAAGDGVAVWIQHDATSDKYRVAAAFRPAGGNFGAPSYVSNTAADAQNTQPFGDVSVAMNASGMAIVTWIQADPGTSNSDVFYAIAAAGGAFGQPQRAVSNGDEHTVGLDAAGDAWLVYRTAESPANVTSAYLAAGASSFHTGSILNPLGDASRTLAHPTVAVDPAGDAVAAWDYDTGSISGGNAREYAQATYAAAGQSLSPSSNVTEGSGYDLEAAAIDATGNGLIAFQSVNSGVLSTSYRATAQGTWSAAAEVPGQDPDNGINTPVSVAMGPNGDAFLAFTADTGTRGVQVAHSADGSTFAAPVTVSNSSGSSTALPFEPRVGVDGQDRPTLLWTTEDQLNGGSTPDTILAVTADSPAGPYSAPVNVAPATDFGPAGPGTPGLTSNPVLSVSSSGQAIALWHDVDSASSSQVLRASFGTLPQVAPPPPPPPPPAPVPSTINIAGSYQPGGPIVLTASVPGATQLTWNLNGHTPGQVTFPSATGQLGAGQDSIRFRPQSRDLLVTVTGTGPFGTKTFTREFTLGQFPLLTSDQSRVRTALNQGNAPLVVAVGNASTLLGRTVCGTLTVYAGQQQTSGCMRPIGVLGDIPARELASVQAMARSLGLDPNNAQLMGVAVQQIDGYIGVGPTTLNNKWPAVPSGGANLISFPGIGVLTSSNAALKIGGLNFGGGPSGFSLNLDPGKLDIPLGSLPKPQLPDLGGFPFVGDWNIDLGSGDASIDAHLQLPSWLSLGGVPLKIPIKFSATPNGLVLDSLDIGPLAAQLGPLGVSNLELKYDRPSDTWTGSAKLCLLTGVCLDMSPPAGEVKIVNGNLNYAGASLDFPDPGVPLFTGVNMTNIGFGVGLDPTRLKATAGLAVGDLVRIQGTVVAGFPTADHPFVLRSDEVGSDFPAYLYGKPFTEPTIGVSAGLSIKLPVLNFVKLGSGYLVYEIPDFIAFGGKADLKIAKVIEIGGSVDAAANFQDETFNINAQAHACLLVIGKLCASAVVDVSRGIGGTGGAGGCIDVGGLHVGGGVQWKRITDPFIWPFDGCKWSRFKTDVRPAIAAASERTIVVRRGQPSPALKIFGRGAAPLVRVTGPGGQSLVSTNKGFDHTPSGTIRILRYEGTAEDFTVVGLEDARPGTYRVTAMRGSVPFETVASTTDLPDAKIAARVTGTGERRTLTYDIRRRPEQTVTFWDTIAGHVSRPIGHVSGGHGRLRFSAPPGTGRRTIYAQFTLAGLPAERIAVAHYVPPAPTLSKPGHLKVTRSKTRVTASWTRVAGATGYEVTVSDSQTGFQRMFRARGPRLVIKNIPLTVGGTLAVRAVDPKYARASLTTAVSLKRVSSPSSKFSKLGKCKLSGSKLTCTGGPTTAKPKPKPKPTKKKHKPTKKKKKPTKKKSS